jgi:hypothetical protein
MTPADWYRSYGSIANQDLERRQAINDKGAVGGPSGSDTMPEGSV